MGASLRNVLARRSRISSRARSRWSGLTRSDLGEGDQAVADAEEGEDLEVFAGLRHDAVVGGDDEDHRVHAAGASHHGLDEILVARHVDDADLPVGDGAGGEAELDRHAALFLLLERVGVAAGEAD